MNLIQKGIIFLSLGSLLMAASCTDESPWGGSNASEGKIELNLLTDNYVTMGTRAGESDDKAFVPEVSKFSVSLKNSDGSYNKNWATVDAFHKEDGFPQGNYTIAAYYGDLDTEGFEKPYYYGESTVQVKLGQTAGPTVTASLCNAMVSVRYSSELASLFPGYSAALQTEGHSPVVFAKNEDRPAYMSPGEASVLVTLTNNQNQQVTINPAKISMTAKHHYLFTIGVKAGENGTSTLTCDITEDIFTEPPIPVPLSDELFSGAGPVVEAQGFDSGVEKKYFDSFVDENTNPEFHVTALGGLKSATLTLTSDKELPIVGGTSHTFNLVNADEPTQEYLKDLKINCFGFFKNADKMGVVNLKEFVQTLKEGSYTVSLSVTDNNTKTSDQTNPIVYKVKITGLSYDIIKVEQPKFMDKELQVTLQTNCDLLKDKFIFSATNEDGELVEIKGATFASSSDSDGVYTYNYKVPVDAINDCEWQVKVQYKDKTPVQKTVDVIMPDFDVETDAFAKKVKIRISNVTNSSLSIEDIISYLNIKINGTKKSASDIDKTTYLSDKILVVKGLDSKNDKVGTVIFDGQYSDVLLYLGKMTNTVYTGKRISFTTEEKINLPFNEETKNLLINPVNVGGGYNVTKDYQIQSSISRSYPGKNWATLNEMTCYTGTLTDIPNTWEVVPSTYFENDQLVIKTVGYSHNSLNLQPTGHALSSTYYCTNKPEEKDLQIRSGEVFLGTFSYDGEEHRTNNIDFNSRPNKITINYNYTSVSTNPEYGECIFKLLGMDKKEIYSQTYKLTSENKPVIIELPDYEFNNKAGELFISFKSTASSLTPDILIPSGRDLDEGVTRGEMAGILFGGNILSRDANNYHAFAVGSELRISNIIFEYE